MGLLSAFLEGFLDDDTGTGASIAGVKTRSGQRVSERTALSLGTYYGCILAISSDIAGMPIRLKRREGDRMVNATDHPLWQFLNRDMNPYSRNMTIRQTLHAQAPAWGNSYAWIERGGNGRPIGMWNLHPSRVRAVKVYESKTSPKFDVAWQVKVGDVTKGRTQEVIVPDEDMFHMPSLGGDGHSGWSALRIGAETFGLNIAAKRFAASYYGNNGIPGVIFKYPHGRKLAEDGKRALKEAWAQAHQGADKAFGAMVLDDGKEFEKIDVPPNEAQFLETQAFGVEEVCRWFRVPPVIVQHNTNTPYTNIESLYQGYVNGALLPWINKFTPEAENKLLTESERGQYEIEIDTKALLKGDINTRGTFYRSMVNSGSMTPNEVRQAEGMNPYDGGDIYVMQSNMTTTENIEEGNNLGAKTGTGNSSDESSDDSSDDSTDSTDSSDASATAEDMQPVILAYCDRLLTKEAKAVQRNKGWKGNDAKKARFYAELQRDASEAAAPISEVIKADILPPVDNYLNARTHGADAYTPAALCAAILEHLNAP